MKRWNRSERVHARQTKALARRRSQLAAYRQGIFTPNSRNRPDGERIAIAEQEITNLERKFQVGVPS